MSRFVTSAGCLVLACVAAGCGSGGDEWTAKRPAVVEAGGTLTLNGKPVEGATISLAPDPPRENDPGAFAMTDSAGGFTLSTFPPDMGAVPGKYKVAVSKVDAGAAGVDPADHDQPQFKPAVKHLIPPKYASAETSGLTLEIPAEGRTDLKIDLK